MIFLGELDPENVGPGIEFATHYEPTPVDQAEALLDALPLAPEHSTFIDIGSGMGRVVLLAARRPYRQIIGVEISPALHQIAKDNRARYAGPALACKDVRLVRADASTFTLPRGDLAVYLYNPFRTEVLGPLVKRLADHSGAVAIAYHTPVERAAIDDIHAFEPVVTFAFGTVWRKAATTEMRSGLATRSPSVPGSD